MIKLVKFPILHFNGSSDDTSHSYRFYRGRLFKNRRTGIQITLFFNTGLTVVLSRLFFHGIRLENHMSLATKSLVAILENKGYLLCH